MAHVGLFFLFADFFFFFSYRFLISTHYTRYDYVLFALNFAALIFVLFPKLPVVRQHLYACSRIGFC